MHIEICDAEPINPVVGRTNPTSFNDMPRPHSILSPITTVCLSALVASGLAACSTKNEPVAPVLPAGAVIRAVSREAPPPPTPVFNVRDFGAKGDGKTPDTVAIQKAVDACAGTGGSVLLERGDFASAPLMLKSDMTFYVAPSARLLGSTDPKDYPVNLPPHPEAGPCQYTTQRSLLSAFDTRNLVIDGGGTIDLRGTELARNGMRGIEPKRASILRVVRGQNTAVRRVALLDSIMWTQVYDRCENLTVEKLVVRSSYASGTIDGMDLCNCRHVVVRDNVIFAEDDGICMKSHGLAGMEDVLIENNVIGSACCGIKMGTASVGDVRHLRIRDNLIFAAGLSGVAMESVDGAHLTDVRIEGLTLVDCAQPMFVRLGRRPTFREMDPKEKPRGAGVIDDVAFKNILAYATRETSKGCPVMGVEGAELGRVSFSDVYLESAGGHSTTPPEPKEIVGGYPESNQYGTMPAFGFFVRHAKGVSFDNVRCGYVANDVRPWLATTAATVETHDCTDLKQVAPLPMSPEILRLRAAYRDHTRHYSSEFVRISPDR